MGPAKDTLTSHKPIRVVIADDHPVVLHSLVSLLSGEPDFTAVAACEDGSTALDAIFKLSPDIALLDLRLPKMTGLEVLEKVSSENTRVVIFTGFAGDRDALAAVSRGVYGIRNTGVYGILIKDSAASTLITCSRRVRRRLPMRVSGISQGASPANGGCRNRSGTYIARAWSDRLIAEGLSNKDMARQLHVSEHRKAPSPQYLLQDGREKAGSSGDIGASPRRS